MKPKAYLLSELIADLQHRNPTLPRDAVERTVRTILGAICETLADGDRVELRGVGTLEVRQRSGGERRNPKTGAAITIEPRRTVHWRTGRQLARALQRSVTPDRAAQ